MRLEVSRLVLFESEFDCKGFMAFARKISADRPSILRPMKKSFRIHAECICVEMGQYFHNQSELNQVLSTIGRFLKSGRIDRNVKVWDSGKWEERTLVIRRN